jgi:hypothetical protein
MKPSPFARVMNVFNSSWEDLAPDLQSEILALVERGVSPVKAVQSVFKSHNLVDKLKLWISTACVDAAENGGVKFVSDLVGRNFFLNKAFQPDGVSLSKRVTKMAFQKDVVSEIQSNLDNEERFGTLVTNLAEYTTEEELPQGLLELERMARKVMAGDVEAFDDFNKVLKREKATALRAIKSGDETPLKRSYLRITKAADRLNEAGLDSAVDRAINQKARAAAYRIAHTETARAYGAAVRTEANNDEDCVGIMWDLSSGEGHCEECEELDQQIFPVDELPEYPAHPHCSCNLSKFYGDKSELTTKDFGDTDDSTIPNDLLLDTEDEGEREAA